MEVLNFREIAEEEIKRAISNLVIQKHGYWIRTIDGRHECSICHMDAPSFRDGTENKSPYCPLCGTRMNEEVTE